MPKDAKRVFEGEIFHVYQWEQKMYDGSTATFEALTRPDTTEIIATVGDKIMIQEQEQPHIPEPFFSFVGGRVEKGEDPLAGAKREMLEEFGCTSEDWRLLRRSDPPGKVHFSIHVYLARNCQEVAAPRLDAGERIKIKHVSFEELMDLIDRKNLSWMEFETRIDFLRAKYDPVFRETFRKQIFGS